MDRRRCASGSRVLHVALIGVLQALALGTSAGAQPMTAITGKCTYDSTLNVTRCEYSIFVGEFPVRQLLIPVPATCVKGVTVSSPFFSATGPAEFKDQTCGSVSGILMTADQPISKMAKTTIVYEGICSVGVILANVETVFGECVTIPVPGVVDCVAESYIAWRIDGVELEIAARKVGTYASQLFSMVATSNTNSGISFSGFGDLLSADGAPAIPLSFQVVETCTPTPPPSFLAPDQFNTLHLSVPGTELPYQFCVWGRFEIRPEHPPSEYSCEAIIRLQMENQKVFVESSP